MQTFELLSSFNYDHLWLELSNLEQEKAWKQAEKCTQQFTKWVAYLNALCVNGLLPWLEEMCPSESATPCTGEEQSPQIWELVTGTAINLGKTRLILIPHESEDLAEIVVPQEWIDIPSWAGDYYLAVQVNTEDGWLRCWGYCDYETIKNQGTYNQISKTYSLPQEELQEDLTLLLVTQQFCPYRKPFIPPLPSLPSSKSQEIIKLASQFLIPRLSISFQEWAPIIEQDNLREEIFQSRQPVKLRAWLEKSFTQAMRLGWENLNTFVANNQLNLTLQQALRSTTAEAIDILYHSDKPQDLKNAAIALGRITPQSSETIRAIAALSHVIETSTDDEARWAAAETLWLLDNNNPNVGIWQGKKIDLGIDIALHSLGLVIALLPKQDNTTAIFLRVYPLGENGTLPPNLKLQILDESENVFKEIITRSTDNLIQYKFWGQPGEEFQISLSLGNAVIKETFLI